MSAKLSKKNMELADFTRRLYLLPNHQQESKNDRKVPNITAFRQLREIKQNIRKK